MSENKKKIEHVENVISDHKKNKKTNEFKVYQFQVYLVALFSGFILLFCLYMVSDLSKLKGYIIEGNYYVDDETIVDLLGIDNNNTRLFVFENRLENILNTHALIESTDISIDNQGILTIHITEKKIVGYRYIDEPELISRSGELIDMQQEFVQLVSMLPLIEGFEMLPVKTDDNFDDYELAQTSYYLLMENLGDLSVSNIEQISEIHQYKYSYDDYGVLCVMKDGNYVYTSLDALSMLEKYNSVASHLPDKKNCLYVDEITQNVSHQLCPEEIEALEDANNDDEASNESPSIGG